MLELWDADNEINCEKKVFVQRRIKNDLIITIPYWESMTVASMMVTVAAKQDIMNNPMVASVVMTRRRMVPVVAVGIAVLNHIRATAGVVRRRDHLRRRCVVGNGTGGLLVGISRSVVVTGSGPGGIDGRRAGRVAGNTAGGVGVGSALLPRHTDAVDLWRKKRRNKQPVMRRKNCQKLLHENGRKKKV